MMRCCSTLAAVLLALASTAHAASLTMSFDQATYDVGDTATLSIVATVESGEVANEAFGILLFSNPSIVLNPVVTQTPLQSFEGNLIWIVGTNPCNSTECTAINQLAAFSSTPNNPRW